MVFKVDGEELKFRTDIITPGIPNLPEELTKFKVRNALLEVSFKPFQSGALEFENMKFADFSKKHGLATLKKFLKVLRGIAEGENQFELRSDGITVFRGEINVKNLGIQMSDFSTMQALCETVSMAREEQDDINLSVNDIFSVHDFATQSSLLASNEMQLRFDGAKNEVTGLTFILATIGVVIADKFFAAIVKRDVSAMHDGTSSQTILHLGNLKWLETNRWCVDKDQNQQETIKKFFSDGIRTMSKGYDVHTEGPISFCFAAEDNSIEAVNRTGLIE